MSFTWIIGLSLTIFALYVVNNKFLRKKGSGSLPPGPSPKPILGNITDLPPKGTQDWVHWMKYKNLYGPISSVNVMGQTIIIINDTDIAKDLLNKRSAIYSSRPHMVFASEMVGWENGLAFQGYTEKFRAYRKAVQPSFGSEAAVSQFNTLQEVEVHRFLLRVLRDPTNLAQHIQTEAGAVILNIAYGYTIEPFERDHLVHITNVVLDQFAKAATPGAWMVDIIPALKYLPSWFPGAGFKQTAKEWREQLKGIADRPYAFVKEQMKNGTHKPSYLSKIFDTSGYPQAGSEKETIAKWTAASLYTGGADTTVSSMECFFLAMALFPDIQRKAQKEIDDVLGPGRLPKMADRAKLPYIDAVVKEVLRWHPVAPMAIPHLSTEDDTYGKYFIPKGSLILANVWAMTHDPEIYHDPMTFKPERFLNIDGRDPEMDPHSIAFGFGRRVCPGRFLADNTVYLSVAQSLAVFNISNATQKGIKIMDSPIFEPGVISHPAPFTCDIEVRGPIQEALILSVEKENPWEPSDAEKLKHVTF
ncbi:O-methylsterigmatocystin oxidoreductase [Penicillium macrosclerotiorum]|uniref:O-methylsterigmatocystin oxidoreductase n=1 Tax=Penicillium macrosclerotiorum TaxID=303699 RepID=UPI0025474684|nr:O-methylsterigmatocystin oxidoreductase [Penicillium macrosclerotiorum]KAJ5683546.1 O-methylsterigmatocystin oxidoreductase [Penicillium macrosclerotiorum]